jgi:hypothetical protein
MPPPTVQTALVSLALPMPLTDVLMSPKAPPPVT